MSKIQSITAREILNSKGNPTIEATVILDDSSVGVAACPSGTSTGAHEAVELHDGDQRRFNGVGVLKAVSHVEKIIVPKLVGMDPFDQKTIDDAMITLDGTENKSHLGANAILSVSMAVAKAAAKSLSKPLYIYLHDVYHAASDTAGNDITIPTPIFNVINGGAHGSGALDFQEFILVPDKKKTYRESLTMGVTLYQTLKKLLKQNKYSILVGDEGGFEPQLQNNYAALDFLKQTIDEAGFSYGQDVFLGLDVAANSFFSDGKYHIKDKKVAVDARELLGYFTNLTQEFKFVYLEDLLSEDDWSDWSSAVHAIDRSVMIVGDDLTATNPQRLQTAIDKKAITAIIIKPNQIGTVTEAMTVTKMAQEAGIKTIVAHRSGETNDDFIADFGVAVHADYVKFGAPARGERVAKYNRLLEIEQELLNRARA